MDKYIKLLKPTFSAYFILQYFVVHFLDIINIIELTAKHADFVSNLERVCFLGMTFIYIKHHKEIPIPYLQKLLQQNQVNHNEEKKCEKCSKID